jgi:hypothetical protein
LTGGASCRARFVVDIMSCLPFGYAKYAFPDLDGGDSNSTAFKLGRILRLTRLLKLLRLFRLFRPWPMCHYMTQPLVELYGGCVVLLKVS